MSVLLCRCCCWKLVLLFGLRKTFIKKSHWKPTFLCYILYTAVLLVFSLFGLRDLYFTTLFFWLCFCYEFSVNARSEVSLYCSWVFFRNSSNFGKASCTLAIVLSIRIWWLILLLLQWSTLYLCYDDICGWVPGFAKWPFLFCKVLFIDCFCYFPSKVA